MKHIHSGSSLRKIIFFFSLYHRITYVNFRFCCSNRYYSLSSFEFFLFLLVTKEPLNRYKQKQIALKLTSHIFYPVHLHSTIVAFLLRTAGQTLYRIHITSCNRNNNEERNRNQHIEKWDASRDIENNYIRWGRGNDEETENENE